MGVWGVGCGVWGMGCGVWGVGCGVWGVGCGVWGVGCGVWGVGCGAWGVGHGRVAYPGPAQTVVTGMPCPTPHTRDTPGTTPGTSTNGCHGDRSTRVAGSRVHIWRPGIKHHGSSFPRLIAEQQIGSSVYVPVFAYSGNPLVIVSGFPNAGNPLVMFSPNAGHPLDSDARLRGHESCLPELSSIWGPPRLVAEHNPRTQRIPLHAVVCMCRESTPPEENPLALMGGGTPPRWIQAQGVR